MKLFVLAVIVAVVAAEEGQKMDQKKKEIAMNMLMMDAKDMKHCMTDAECTDAARPKCCTHMRLCGPADMPSADKMQKQSCSSNADCKAAHRCHNGMCHFTGPKGCDSNADCMQGVDGMMMDCMEMPKSMPGKRCWAKCTMDKDCHNCDGADGKCRMPEEFRAKIGCCDGHCQKKSACNA
ncbi:uncharacterized protein LOC129583410 [Paramacrobiotus metropolitanus]|uniref:uncharacterized protein LOC129583410 n=1 Tax=Paramacrobiotus metropolitanus TaxID=2943436 RepID=UPI0024455E9A|nr:uncharacterized protein LOC129583410 [Paramacrobiotus metropolitanus]